MTTKVTPFAYLLSYKHPAKPQGCFYPLLLCPPWRTIGPRRGASPNAARRQRTGAAHDAPKARRLHLPARRKPDAAPKASAVPAAPAKPETAPAKDDLFAAWDRAPAAAQPVTPAAPKPAAPAAPEAAAPAPKPAAPAQPKPAAQPAAEAADPLLAYLNSTPAAPAEPETPKPDDATDGSANGAAYSLDDILAEFSDF